MFFALTSSLLHQINLVPLLFVMTVFFPFFELSLILSFPDYPFASSVPLVPPRYSCDFIPFLSTLLHGSSLLITIHFLSVFFIAWFSFPLYHSFSFCLPYCMVLISFLPFILFLSSILQGSHYFLSILCVQSKGFHQSANCSTFLLCSSKFSRRGFLHLCGSRSSIPPRISLPK